MNKIYIDFDGVILDTWEVILKKYKERYHTSIIEENKIKFLMLDIGWGYILENSEEISNSINKIHQISKKYGVSILSKINSNEEKEAKIKFLKKHGINNFYFVSYDCQKTQVVDPCKNILIDDDVKNLEEWEHAGGNSIFFNKDLKNYDSYGNENKNFIIINDLIKIYDII